MSIKRNISIINIARHLESCGSASSTKLYRMRSGENTFQDCIVVELFYDHYNPKTMDRGNEANIKNAFAGLCDKYDDIINAEGASFEWNSRNASYKIKFNLKRDVLYDGLLYQAGNISWKVDDYYEKCNNIKSTEVDLMHGLDDIESSCWSMIEDIRLEKTKHKKHHEDEKKINKVILDQMENQLEQYKKENLKSMDMIQHLVVFVCDLRNALDSEDMIKANSVIKSFEKFNSMRQ